MTDKEKSIKQDKTRAKDWTFIVYPESAPEDWRSILADRLQVKAIISPLHDKDILMMSSRHLKSALSRDFEI